MSNAVDPTAPNEQRADTPEAAAEELFFNTEEADRPWTRKYAQRIIELCDSHEVK